MKSPLSSPTSHFFNKRFLQEPIKSLLPSPNTSASFFNNECDPIKSPMACHSLFRPSSDLLPIPAMEKNSIKSPLQTPTRSVFLQSHVDSTLFDVEKYPMKSPLNTPTRPGFLPPQDFFIMPEPISIKTEPIEQNENEKIKTEETKSDFNKFQRDLNIKFRSEKENIAEGHFSSEGIKQEPIDLDFNTDRKSDIYDGKCSVNQDDLSIKTEKEDSVHSDSVPALLPLDCHKINYKAEGNYFGVKKEPISSIKSEPRSQNSCSSELHMNFSYNHFIDLGESYLNSAHVENPYASHAQLSHSNLTSRLTNHDFNENNSIVSKLQLMKTSGTYNRAHTYNKSKNNSNVFKRSMGDKNDADGNKKLKKEQDDERPRRPMNAFMLFAKHQRPLLIQQHPGKDNR